MTQASLNPEASPELDLPLKHRLLLAAEKVVAQRGFAGVTVQEIHKAADSRNTSAIHYHYGNLEALLSAVFRHRVVPLKIDELRKTADVRAIVSALVRALAVFLEPEAGGNHYLRFLERAMLETGVARALVPLEVLRQWDQAELLMREKLTSALSAQLADVRIALVRTCIISGLAQVEVWVDNDQETRKLLPMLLQAVIDSCLAIVTAPVSAELVQEMSALGGAEFVPDKLR